jgi:acetoin utilization protein AcuB
MKREPQVGQLMTECPHTIERDAPLLGARRLMLDHHIRHLPVVHQRDLVGLISDRDIKLVLGPEFDYPNPRELTVADVMVETPYVVDLDTALRTVLRHMADAHIGAAVVTRSGRLAGIFTATDACRHFATWLENQFPPPTDGNDSR